MDFGEKERFLMKNTKNLDRGQKQPTLEILGEIEVFEWGRLEKDRDDGWKAS